MRSILILSGAVGVMAMAAPVSAQDGKIREIEVFGNDPCPRSTDDAVVICARKSEADRYRIPEKLRTGGTRQSRQAWAARAKSFETVGATGVNSCSPVGPGGFTGCTMQLIRQQRAERETEAGE